MKITEEKLTYLLFIYQYQNTSETISSLAKKLGVSKSTLSRVLTSFYNEGWLKDKGKMMLSNNGIQIAKCWKQDVECMERWLCSLGNQKDDSFKQEAITLAVNLSDDTRRKLTNTSYIDKLFYNLSDIKQIHGDVLGVYLQDGTYPFAFTIYKEDTQTCSISMANEAFLHPAQLHIESSGSYLSFKSCEVEYQLMGGKVMVKDRPSELIYYIDDMPHEVYAHNYEFRIPIDTIIFYHSKQERMLQASIPVHIKTHHNIHVMPEKKAVLQIIFK